MKTPEQMADEYANNLTRESERFIRQDVSYAFFFGYAAAQPKWISVKERLPEKNSLVVILHEDEMNLNYRKPPVYFGKHNGQYWLETLDHSDVTWSGMCNITHWMPLPEAPKEIK